MPTAAKLVAAALFAVLGAAAVRIYGPLLPEATPLGGLVPSVVVIGLLCGWLLMGRSTGVSYGAAMGNGISTGMAVGFWMLVLWSGVEMIERSTKMRYDGPLEAVLGGLGLMVEYATLMLNAPFLAVVLIGSGFTGFVTEAAARRWS
jgi:uncharacterized membrane protein